MAKLSQSLARFARDTRHRTVMAGARASLQFRKLEWSKRQTAAAVLMGCGGLALCAAWWSGDESPARPAQKRDSQPAAMLEQLAAPDNEQLLAPPGQSPAGQSPAGQSPSHEDANLVRAVHFGHESGDNSVQQISSGGFVQTAEGPAADTRGAWLTGTIESIDDDAHAPADPWATGPGNSSVPPASWSTSTDRPLLVIPQ